MHRFATAALEAPLWVLERSKRSALARVDFGSSWNATVSAHFRPSGMTRLSISPACIAVAALVSVTAPLGASAQAILSTGNSYLRSSFAVGERAADGNRQAGLVLDIAPGWKTYWRVPGGAGVAPRFDWAGSRNLRNISIDWPRPEVFESFGLRTLGYSGHVVLPLTLIPEDPFKPIILDLRGTVGVCRDICVLEEISLTRSIQPSTTATDALQIAAARATVPPPGAEVGLSIRTCRLERNGEDFHFAARFALPEDPFGRSQGTQEPIVALEDPPDAWFHDQIVHHSGTELSVSAVLSLSGAGTWIDRSVIRMTVLAGHLAAEVEGCPSSAG